MDNYLEVTSLAKTYKNLKVSGASFSAGPGDILGLVGEANSGITLLTKMLLGLARADRGDIGYFGINNFADEMAVKQQLGVFMAESYFPENLTVKNVDGFLGGVYRGHSSARFMDYCKRFMLDEKKRMKDLTIPQKLRVNMAAMLSHGAKLLVIDGATRGVDAHERDFVNGLLEEYMAESPDHAVVMAARLMSELPAATNRVCFLRRGDQLFSGERSRPSDVYGLVRMGTKEYEAFDKAAALGARETDSGYDVLVALEEVQNLELAVEPAKIDDIVSLTRKGVA